ncbi:MarC family protein [Zwartia sp.]|uniref:MarC family protein n=1 Tax=Zwartia sp. TaxID=2978004 RepID=UPI00271DB500|nr:MarC family protein [Zwartia sp.]MDO9025263.1 MarC family protein [Zwartia sp.]
MFPSDFVYEFFTLLVILDPIATVPVFLAVTYGLPWREALKVALAALSVAFGILTAFIFLGLEFLKVLDIPTPSFQLAGSFILFTLGLSMVTGKMHEEIAKMPANASIMERSIYPLAMPSIAGAGAILTVVMLSDNNARVMAEQLQTTFVVLLCLSIHLATFMAGGLIIRYVGMIGIQVITRVFGLMICSIAVSGMVIAIKESFGI